MEPFILVSALGKRRLLRVAEVREIVPMMAFERADDDEGRYKGLINLRGEIIPIFELDACPVQLSTERYIVISESEDSPLGLLVDDVHDVVEIPASQVAVRSVGAGRSEAFARLDSAVIAVLSPGAVTLAGN